MIAEGVGVHIDTIFRIKARRNHPSPELARKLEKFLNIDRRRFLYPEEFGDPWEVLNERYARYQ
jgi:hypothetical protein